MTEDVIDAEEVNKALSLIKKIKEVPNPKYQKWKKDRESFVPVKGSIKVTNKALQPILGEQMRNREKVYTVKLLSMVCDICQCCPDCSDCSWSCEVKAIDFCERVKRNLGYLGVLEE